MPNPRWILCHCLALLLGCSVAQAGNFNIQVGDTVIPGVPAAGAGQIDVVTDVDTYFFNGTAGQIIYLEEISMAAAFKGYLQWDIKTPSGTVVGSGYFEGSDQARMILPATASYALRVKVGSANTSYIGDYSFKLWAVAPDQNYAIQIGDTVSNGVPAAGAGNLETAGAQDVYTFPASTGQLAFFQENSVAPAFRNYLLWELKAPSGQRVFLSYMAGTDKGRVEFPETGTYTLRVSCGYNDVTYIGTYSFSILPIPPESIVPINIGDTISDGVPTAGAGKIEVPGSEDWYSFQGSAGQNLFFDRISSDASLGGYLMWELKAPSGAKVFTSYFSGDAGRKTLPENGTYVLHFWVGIGDPTLLGKYSFKISTLEDNIFAINLGQTVTNGVPGPGAGQIETAGGQDLYSFSGTTGQKIRFQSIFAAPAFGGYLQYQIRAPSSNQVALAYLTNNREVEYVLPETGAYSVRVFVGLNDASKIGLYSFRIYSPVVARPDQLVVAPGQSLFIPEAKFLCNDSGETGDSLDVLMTNSTSQYGGTLVETNGTWHYTPAVGWTGNDSFTYRLVGNFGGSAQGLVSVRIVEGAAGEAMVVSLSRMSATTASVCLLGEPGQTYVVEKSIDLVQWEAVGNITADSSGSMSYQYSAGAPDRIFFRFRK